MVRDSDIIRQHLGKADMRLVIENARKASIGGRSEVRGADRKLISNIVRGKLWKDTGGPIKAKSRATQAA